MRVPRPIRVLQALTLFAFATIASADAIRLVAPAAGTTLRGGAFAELHWSATELPRATEEWEAFLSIDGGRYYAFRITPHLNIELRRFTFVVPNVDTADARILLRTGDEAEEAHIEIPASFAIVRDAHAPLPLRSLVQSGDSEAAREGDADVVAWTDGARNGSGIVYRASTPAPLRSITGIAPVASEASAVHKSGENGIAHASFVQAITPRDAQVQKPQPLPRFVDLLLVCRRRNI